MLRSLMTRIKTTTMDVKKYEKNKNKILVFKVLIPALARDII